MQCVYKGKQYFNLTLSFMLALLPDIMSFSKTFTWFPRMAYIRAVWPFCKKKWLSIDTKPSLVPRPSPYPVYDCLQNEEKVVSIYYMLAFQTSREVIKNYLIYNQRWKQSGLGLTWLSTHMVLEIKYCLFSDQSLYHFHMTSQWSLHQGSYTMLEMCVQDVHMRCAYEMCVWDVFMRCVYEMCVWDVCTRCVYEMCVWDVCMRCVYAGTYERRQGASNCRT